MPETTVRRVEIRFPKQAREVGDLEKLAQEIMSNPTRRGEAATFLLKMWSRVLHGEMSPVTFWDLFGVQMEASSGVTPSKPSSVATPIASVIDPEAEKKKEKRERARKNSQAGGWEP